MVRTVIVRRRDQFEDGESVGGTSIVLLILTDDHRALIVEIGLGDGQRRHSVRLEPEPEGQLMRRKGQVIDRLIKRSKCTEIAAGVTHQALQRVFAEIGGALEHHVLE